jgi:hypothetical protein
MLGQVSIAAATAVVGYDLTRDTVWQQSDRPRRMLAVGLAGSAAALDTEVSIFVGNVKVGDMFNSGTGAPNRDSMFRMGDIVPAGQEIHVLIVDQPSTNPINLAVDFQDA